MPLPDSAMRPSTSTQNETSGPNHLLNSSSARYGTSERTRYRRYRRADEGHDAGVAKRMLRHARAGGQLNRGGAESVFAASLVEQNLYPGTVGLCRLGRTVAGTEVT